MRYTPMRCIPGKHKMYAREVHTYEMHTYEMHTYEMHIYEMHTYEMHTRGMYTYEIHNREAYTSSSLSRISLPGQSYLKFRDQPPDGRVPSRVIIAKV
jgi:hypothetical protein